MAKKEYEVERNGEPVYQTGYFGKPGTYHVTMVHVVYGGNPICGYNPASSMEFQFCAAGIYMRFVECAGCREAVERMKIMEDE